jgi:hypothetical protein
MASSGRLPAKKHAPVQKMRLFLREAWHGENGGREEIIIFAMILFRVCTEEGINRDCGESLMCNPSGSQHPPPRRRPCTIYNSIAHNSYM